MVRSVVHCCPILFLLRCKIAMCQNNFKLINNTLVKHVISTMQDYHPSIENSQASTSKSQQKDSLTKSGPQSNFQSNIKPLSSPSEYSLWSIRIKARLKKHNLWNDKIDAPMDHPENLDLLLCSLEDSLAKQVLVSAGENPSEMWKYLQSIHVTRSISAKTKALNDLLIFNYNKPTMIENQAEILSMKANLIAIFGSKSIEIDELISMICMTNLPVNYQPLRTTMQETSKSDNLTIASLFESLIREESNQISSAAHRASYQASSVAHRAQATTKTQKCKHGRETKSCFTCSPENRPTCRLCQTSFTGTG